MTIDYRKKYYDSYYTAFNSQISKIDAKIIDSLFAHYDYKVLPHLNNFAKDSLILELGCGPGYLLDYLKLNGFNNITGVDISREQVELANSKGHHVLLDDIFNYLRNSSDKFDIIFAFDLIEHFTKDELLELTNLIFNSLSDAGLFIIRTPNGQGYFSGHIIYGDLTHQTIFTPNSLTQLLANAGFNNIDFSENAPVKKNLTGIVRATLWSVIKSILNFTLMIENGGSQKIWTRDFYCFAKK
ncbi:class I SAM-dependent methyltransferase [Ignavibacterium sp.]|uniref:class I SAM-dependent DNA methyltransferase n=1 Tax=Ignavibacterium sp. TaxID=2651167 RepID=UPI00307F1B72